MKLAIFLLVVILAGLFQHNNIISKTVFGVKFAEGSENSEVLKMSWKGFIEHWVSFQLRNTLKTEFLEVQSNLFLISKTIYIICFGSINPHRFPWGRRKVLCGSLKNNGHYKYKSS